MRELCSVLDVDEAALSQAVTACNARRVDATGGEGRRRVYVTGSGHRDTALAEAVANGGGAVVEGRPVPTDEDAAPVGAIARRYEHPLLAGARASSVERAAATAADAAAVAADLVLAFYLEGDDGLRWEYPEQRAAVEAAGIPMLLLDHQPYDLRGLELQLDV